MTRTAMLHLDARGEREIVMTREFDAPRHLVYEALTTPALIRRWLGVMEGWSMAVCDVDLRVGGSFRYQWRGPGGVTLGMRGVYREIVPDQRIVSTEVFDESWYPGEAVGTVELVERSGRTTLTTTVLYSSREARDAVLKSPMESGVAKGYDQLDAVLASLGSGGAA
ncbi:MAG: SRPBCC family protein [Gemmatimonadaceae bacterium]|nr:SRPBCC family protein [Gemmatimonadaceae bacterium]NUP71075.1 SRPBCC family protein [Gemmatimonadaceae bacterium]